MSKVPARHAVLRITTAGSVDDGKSTLIGRLLYESSAILDDQLESLQKQRKIDGAIDLSLLTDGLKSEREQGITIDVAYKYFASTRRKYILADAPGHVQYTRNMVTAASRADAAIILVDASLGVLEQTRRHAYLAYLLGVPQIILAINKIDRIAYDAQRVAAIEAEFRQLSWNQAAANSLSVIPLSALRGDNIRERSALTPWYQGPSLLELLDELSPREAFEESLRLPLQFVGRSKTGQRFATGTINRGHLQVNDRIRLLPSQRESAIAALWVHGKPSAAAEAGDAVAVVLKDEIDLERGQLLLAAHDSSVRSSRQLQAQVVWFDTAAFRPQERYLLRMGTQSSRAQISSIHHRFDLETLQPVAASGLQMNDIARVEIQSSRALMTAPFKEDKAAGAFILIDPQSFRTVAAGMIEALLDLSEQPASLGRLSVVDAFHHRPQQTNTLQISTEFLKLNALAQQMQALGLLLELGWTIQLENSSEAERLRRALVQHGYGSFEQGSGI